MKYNFFADRTDKLRILQFIFSDTDLRVYDNYSLYGQEVCEYSTVDEIAEKFDLDNGDNFAVTFQLWSPRHKTKPVFGRIELDPKRSGGHSFRFVTDCWGLIQLYFGGIKDNQLNHSHIGHFNERNALKWERIRNLNGNVSDWDWSEIQHSSRRLKYHILNNLATRKIGSFGVLEGVQELEKNGIVITSQNG